jgi:hypothetical protein
MAITDIHINKKIIIKHIVDTSHVSVSFASHYVHDKVAMLGFYNLNSTHICLMLDRINNTFSSIFKNKTMEEKVCYCLTHEEIHHWLNENIDSLTCWKFDNIAYKFMEDM